MDTRKTLPGLRLAQKYAVRLGGGESKVWTLGCFLVKENHLITLGGLKKLANLIGVIDSKEEDRKLFKLRLRPWKNTSLR